VKRSVAVAVSVTGGILNDIGRSGELRFCRWSLCRLMRDLEKEINCLDLNLLLMKDVKMN
jgi:hypothetical protein